MDKITHSGDFDRVRANTWPEVNQRLDAQAAARILSAANHEAGPSRQLVEVDREWDFARVLESESSLMGLVGLALGVGVHRGFLFVPGFVAAMVFLHATQGFYPLLPLFRRLGIRSQDEIDRERYALKALRGDFDGVSAQEKGANRAAAAWQAVCT